MYDYVLEELPAVLKELFPEVGSALQEPLHKVGRVLLL